jgi:hypothetical protein
MVSLTAPCAAWSVTSAWGPDLRRGLWMMVGDLRVPLVVNLRKVVEI